VQLTFIVAAVYFYSDDITEANRLMSDLEPTTPQEYILKGVVNAVLGQEHGIVCRRCLFIMLRLYFTLSCSLAVLDPWVGYTMNVLSPFIPVLCHSD